MKKIIFVFIFSFNFIFADTLLTKCSQNNKTMIYYKNMNNKNSYNGWYEVSGLNCNNGATSLNANCNDQGSLSIIDDMGVEHKVIGVNCSGYTMSYPQSNYIF